MVKKIKILGSRYFNCINLENNVKLEFDKSCIDTKVTYYKEMGDYGIMSTSPLVINEGVVNYDRVNGVVEIIKFLRGEK